MATRAMPLPGGRVTPVARWPPIRRTWEIIKKAIEEEFTSRYYRNFPNRKLALMDYWMARMIDIRAEIQAEIAVKAEGKPPYKY